MTDAEKERQAHNMLNGVRNLVIREFGVEFDFIVLVDSPDRTVSISNIKHETRAISILNSSLDCITKLTQQERN